MSYDHHLVIDSRDVPLLRVVRHAAPIAAYRAWPRHVSCGWLFPDPRPHEMVRERLVNPCDGVVECRVWRCRAPGCDWWAVESEVPPHLRAVVYRKLQKLV